MAKDTMKFYATGRRKTAIARVWLFPGEGKITINRRDAESYLNRATNIKLIEQPLNATGTREQYDIWCTARDPLKAAGYLTRDPRKVERKKYGRKGARARFQFSKR